MPVRARKLLPPRMPAQRARLPVPALAVVPADVAEPDAGVDAAIRLLLDKGRAIRRGCPR